MNKEMHQTPCAKKAAVKWQDFWIWQQTKKTQWLIRKIFFHLAVMLWALYTWNLVEGGGGELTKNIFFFR